MTVEPLIANNSRSIQDIPRIIIQQVHELVMKRSRLVHKPDPELKNMQKTNNIQIRTITVTDKLKAERMTRFAAKTDTRIAIAVA